MTIKKKVQYDLDHSDVTIEIQKGSCSDGILVTPNQGDKSDAVWVDLDELREVLGEIDKYSL